MADKTRAVAVAQQPLHLHRCRLARKGQQPIAGRVAREIDQYVDPVMANLCGKRLITQSDSAMPVIG